MPITLFMIFIPFVYCLVALIFWVRLPRLAPDRRSQGRQSIIMTSLSAVMVVGAWVMVGPPRPPIFLVPAWATVTVLLTAIAVFLWLVIEAWRTLKAIRMSRSLRN